MNRLLTAMERFSAKRLTFGGKPVLGEVIVQRDKDDTWINATDKSKKPSEKRMERILDQLSGANIKEFVTKIPAGESDGLKVSVGDESEPNKRVFVFWKNAGKVYARDLKSKRNEAFELAPSVGDALPWSQEAVTQDPAAAAPAAGGGDEHGHGEDDGHGH